jgi:hypothetical protein
VSLGFQQTALAHKESVLRKAPLMLPKTRINGISANTPKKSRFPHLSDAIILRKKTFESLMSDNHYSEQKTAG